MMKNEMSFQVSLKNGQGFSILDVGGMGGVHSTSQER